MGIDDNKLKFQKLTPKTDGDIETYCDAIDFVFKETVHSFRHFTASALISQGVDVVSIQSVLGHSMPNTTLNIYSHAFSNVQEKDAQAVVNVLEWVYDHPKTKFTLYINNKHKILCL